MAPTTTYPIKPGTTCRLLTHNGGDSVVKVTAEWNHGEDLHCETTVGRPHPFTVEAERVRDVYPFTLPADLEPGDTFIHPSLKDVNGNDTTFTVEAVEAGIRFPGDGWKGDCRALRFKGRGHGEVTRILLFLDQPVEVVF